MDDWMIRHWLQWRLQLRGRMLSRGCVGDDWRMNNQFMAQYIHKLGGMAGTW